MAIILPTVSSVDNPVGWGYDAHIDDLLLRLAVSPESLLEKITAQSQPQRIDTAESADDIRDETGYRYSRSNLSGGAGFSFLHEPDRPVDASSRYWSSRGVNVFSENPGELYSAPLLHSTENGEVTSDTSVQVAQVDGVVYWSDDTDVYEAGDSGSKETVAATQMIGMGNSLYLLVAGTGVVKLPPATFTAATFDNTVYDKIWAAKSRIFGVADNLLYEADISSPILVLTLPTGDTVTDVVDAGSFILVFATTGTIYTLTLDDSLAVIPVSEAPFISEVPLIGGYTQGIVGIATAQTVTAGGTIMRFYTATLNDAGTPVDVQLVIQVGDEYSTTDYTPSAVLESRDSFYVTALSDVDATTQTWRYYLPTGGWARDLEFATVVTASSIVEANDRIWLAVPGVGLFNETNLYVTSGWVIGPAADFSTSDLKQWVGSSVNTKLMPSGARIELWTSVNVDDLDDSDSAGWTFDVSVRAGETEKRSDTTPAVNSRYHAAKVVWHSSASHASTPEFLSYGFRAYATPDREQVFRIPVNVSDQYESPGRRAMSSPGRGKAILEALNRYEGESVTFGVYPLPFEIRGIVEQIDISTSVIALRGSSMTVAYVQIKGKASTENIGYGGTTHNIGFALDGFIEGMFAVGKDIA